MKKVTVYSTPTCPYCKMAKNFLDEKGVKYESVDVATDHKGADEMIKKSGQMGVPVIVVGGEGEKEEVVVGFDQAKLVSSLGLK